MVTRGGIQDSDGLNWSEILFGYENVLAAPESRQPGKFWENVAGIKNHCGHGFDDIDNALHNHVMSVSGESKDDGDTGVPSNANSITSQHSENVAYRWSHCLLQLPITTAYSQLQMSSINPLI